MIVHTERDSGLFHLARREPPGDPAPRATVCGAYLSDTDPRGLQAALGGGWWPCGSCYPGGLTIDPNDAADPPAEDPGGVPI
jgi:hypothetical protein